MRTNKRLHASITLVGLLIASRANATLSLSSCSNTSVCTNQSVCLTTTAPVAGGVYDEYNWTLERNGEFVDFWTTYNEHSMGGEQTTFGLTNTYDGSGTYQIHVDAWIYDYALGTYWNYSDSSNGVPVAFQSATASSKINNSSSQTPSAFANQPIVLNGSSSVCASGYFVSIQKSNSNWGGTGTECMRWLNASDYNKYGSINNFDLKGFFSSCGQTFTPGQYYRVKLAVGNPWNETVKLVYIPPATPNFTVKNSSNVWVVPPADGSPIDVCASNITINAAGTNGESRYDIVVQESDPWWNRTYQYEWGHWFSGQAPNGIKLQNLASIYSYPPDFTGAAVRQGTILYGGNLPNGSARHFRVSVCTDEPTWTCKSALLRVIGSCLTSSPPQTNNETWMIQDDAIDPTEMDIDLLESYPDLQEVDMGSLNTNVIVDD